MLLLTFFSFSFSFHFISYLCPRLFFFSFPLYTLYTRTYKGTKKPHTHTNKNRKTHQPRPSLVPSWHHQALPLGDDGCDHCIVCVSPTPTTFTPPFFSHLSHFNQYLPISISLSPAIPVYLFFYFISATYLKIFFFFFELLLLLLLPLLLRLLLLILFYFAFGFASVSAAC